MNNEHVTAEHIIRAFESQKAATNRWREMYEYEHQRFLDAKEELVQLRGDRIDAEETDARPGDWGWRVVIACASFFAGMLMRGWL